AMDADERPERQHQRRHVEPGHGRRGDCTGWEVLRRADDRARNSHGTRMTRRARITADLNRLDLIDLIRADPRHPCHPCSMAVERLLLPAPGNERGPARASGPSRECEKSPVGSSSDVAQSSKSSIPQDSGILTRLRRMSK